MCYYKKRTYVLLSKTKTSYMNNSNQFLLARQSYQEILDELHPEYSNNILSTGSPILDKVIPTLGPLPPATIPLGIARDGLPVLMNLDKPSTGPLMIIADGKSGKTDFLKTLAINTNHDGNSGDIQFGVVTNSPEEWKQVDILPGSMGIWPADHPSAGDFLTRLIYWAEALPGSRQFILLLIDDLDMMKDLSLVCRHALRWLFMNGPTRHIWPVVSLNTCRIGENVKWLDLIPTYIFGKIVSEKDLSLLRDIPDNPNNLLPMSEFTVRLKEGWIIFSISFE